MHGKLAYALLLTATLLASSDASTAGEAGAAPMPEVLPVTSEPDHKIRFDNGRVRLIEAAIPKGKSSLFHTHVYDAFFVFFHASEVGNQLLGEKPVFVKLPAGAAHFTSTAAGPYSHSVIAADQAAVHVSALELMQPSSAKAGEGREERFPPFQVVIDNLRGRLYRLNLAPGEATEPFIRPTATAILAVTAGRISEKAGGKPARLWDFEPGHFRWIEAGEELSIKNESSGPIHLVEIEVF
jgi:hypothetical protein